MVFASTAGEFAALVRIGEDAHRNPLMLKAIAKTWRFLSLAKPRAVMISLLAAIR